MRNTSVLGEPTIVDDNVLLRISVEDPAVPEGGGVFECRMKDYGDVQVTLFPSGQSASPDAEFRVEAASEAMRFALENTELFDPLFETLRGRARAAL